jgi:putative ABC transport system permease protein
MAADLSPWQVGLAALLILVNAAVSLALRLGLERQLLLAAARMVVQLLLVGQVLALIFDVERWFLVLALAAVMAVVAGIAAVRRVSRPYPGIWLTSTVSIWLASWLITAYALLAVVQVERWYDPQYAIPVLGMVLGNLLNGVSLGLERLTDALVVHRGRVEGLLVLGATRWEAARQPVQQAVRTGMIPMINTMMVTGIVSLPGMMTGQILAERQPMKAVKYQIVILFLIASATALGTIGAVLLGYLRLFNRRHQFCYWLLSERK